MSDGVLYRLLVQPRAGGPLIRCGVAEYRDYDYSFEFNPIDFSAMHGWIIGASFECSTWEHFGMGALPTTMDDIHVWHETKLVVTGSRVEHGYTSALDSRLFLVPRFPKLPQHAFGFHTLESSFACPIEGCAARACQGRPLCVFHWPGTSESEMGALFRAALGPERDAVLQQVCDRRKLKLCLPASPPVPATPGKRRAKLA